MDPNNLDPEQLRQAFAELTRVTEDTILAQRGYIKDADGSYKKLNKATESRAEIEDRIHKELVKQFGAETILKERQQEQFKRELASIGYVVDANNKLQKSIGSTATELSNLQKQQLAYAKTLDASGKSFAELVGKNKSLSDVTGVAKDHLYDLAKGSKLGTASLMVLEEAAKLAQAAIIGLYKGAESMAKALYNGERGQKVAARGVEVFTKEITSATASLGKLLIGLGAATAGLAILAAPFTGGLSLFTLGLGAAGIALGGLITAGSAAAEKLAELNTAAAEQTDLLFDTFNALSKASLAGARGMEGILSTLHTMGLTTKEAEKFKAVLMASTKELKMFGATANEGVENFAKVAGDLVKSEFGATLRQMGITSEEQHEHVLKYMAQQTRFGLMQGKSVSDLQKGAAKYIEELDALATLTGATRKEQEDARNYIMSIEALRAKMLITEDAEEKKRLERLANYAEKLASMGLQRTATGVAQRAAAGGAITTVEAAEAYNTQGAIYDRVARGQGTLAENLTKGINELKAFAKQAAAVGQYGVPMEGYMGEKFASIGDAILRLEKMQTALEEARKSYKGPGQFDEGKFLEEFAKKNRLATDDQTTAQVKLIDQQRELAILEDQMVNKFAKSVTINATASELFKTAVEHFAGIVNKDKSNQAPALPGSAITQAAAKERKEAQSKVEDLTRQLDKAKADKNADEIKRLRIELHNAREEARRKTLEEQTAAHNAVMSKAPGISVPFTPSTAGAGRSSGMGGATAEDLKKIGLRIKEGDVQRPGAHIDDRILDLAQKVQSSLGSDLGYFSGFNDKYHMEKSPNSKHKQGLAFDFVLANGRFPSKEEGAKIVSLLKSLGADHAIDEYNNPSKNAIGAGHFHAELKARFGGIFDGPDKGYSVELHGKEAIIPMPDLQALLNRNNENVTQQPLSELNKITKTEPSKIFSDINETSIAELYSLMEDKLTSVIDRLDASVATQEELLRYSRA